MRMVSCLLQTTAGVGPLHVEVGPRFAVAALPRDLSRSSRYTMARHSKLQKQVLSLYRQFLRASKEKPGFLPCIQAEFRKNARIPRMDVMHIEYLLRRGQRQLEQLRDVNTKQMGTFVKTKPEER
ncbi:succinate dehydrogenase assembly factor 1, mitochondrial [Chelonia mydas]|uniref:succinate dehydrogenase assembly factor 1, mitochondrial n=1 Tax=Chelonia mydas TaxID=8469 RepID=UPI0018A21021|nr:succinate dehydrogenase assembly factor 1, mitochondrial [Chelonia mydas]XP_037740593.1 succinate dehydrogenase assembly factor 1, mitochondrial [Chelonia mydas]XP_037740594.1 succinate dehydrogenase assembly factor 1, mitochondrial [Chelonia mydas]